MNYKNIITFLLLFASLTTLANSKLDSIGVENLNGKKVILHQVEAKESYYSLSRKYKVSPQIIMDFNKGKVLQPSETVKIPTTLDFTNKPTSFSSATNTKVGKEVIHKVIAKETLYSIASKYNMRVDDLKLLNNLTNSGLSIGQSLKVLISDEVSLNQRVETNSAGKPVLVENKPELKPIEKEVSKIKYVDSTDSQSTLEIPKNRYGITEINDKGLAVWINDDNLDASKSYALHRTAPVGTIVKITNPMTGRSVFAKVVGKYTENQTTKDVIIVLTKASADAIGALDKRFLVNITFGIPNEQ